MATEFKPRVMQANVCSRCGARQAHVHRYNDTVEFKGLTIDVEGLVETRCTNCHHRWSTQEQDVDNLARIRVAFAEKRDQVRLRDGLLTGDEIAAILHELGLNRTQAAAVFGGGPNAFAKYINGEVLQSVAMDRLLRLVQRAGAPAVAFLRDVQTARAVPVIAMEGAGDRATGRGLGGLPKESPRKYSKLVSPAPIVSEKLPEFIQRTRPASKKTSRSSPSKK